jgi:hypothetical protein
LSWILLGTLSLRGQDQSSASGTPPAITTDRPAITDSSLVVPSGDLLFENGLTETASQGQRSFDFPETLVRFGLTSTTELRFTAPDYFQHLNAGSGFGSAWGDLSLGVKQQLVATSAGFDASLVASLSFPSGANSISSHGYDPQLIRARVLREGTSAAMVASNIQELDRRWYVFAFVADRRCQAQSNRPSEFSAGPPNHQPMGRFCRVRGRLSATRRSATSASRGYVL